MSDPSFGYREGSLSQKLVDQAEKDRKEKVEAERREREEKRREQVRKQEIDDEEESRRKIGGDPYMEVQYSKRMADNAERQFMRGEISGAKYKEILWGYKGYNYAQKKYREDLAKRRVKRLQDQAVIDRQYQERKKQIENLGEDYLKGEYNEANLKKTLEDFYGKEEGGKQFKFYRDKRVQQVLGERRGRTNAMREMMNYLQDFYNYQGDEKMKEIVDRYRGKGTYGAEDQMNYLKDLRNKLDREYEEATQNYIDGEMSAEDYQKAVDKRWGKSYAKEKRFFDDNTRLRKERENRGKVVKVEVNVGGDVVDPPKVEDDATDDEGGEGGGDEGDDGEDTEGVGDGEDGDEGDGGTEGGTASGTYEGEHSSGVQALGESGVEVGQETEGASENISSSRQATISIERGRPYKSRRTVSQENIDEVFEICVRFSHHFYENKIKVWDAIPVIRAGTSFLKKALEEVFPVDVIQRQNRLYVAVAGTRTFGNVATDLNAGKSQINANYPNLYGVLQQKAFITGFHTGFLKEVDQTYNLLRIAIDGFYGKCDKIIFTGHSAGTIAVIYAYCYHFDLRDQDKKLQIENVITFGSPRFIEDTPDGVRNFNEALPNYIRCFLTQDPVPYLPFPKDIPVLKDGKEIQGFGYGFIHCGTPFCLDSNLLRNDVNVLLEFILDGQKDVLALLLKDETMLMSSYLTHYILSDGYLGLILGNVADVCSNFRLKKDITRRQIEFLGLELKYRSNELSTMSEKCNLLRPLSIADRLEVEPLELPEMPIELKEFLPAMQSIMVALSACTSITACSYYYNIHVEGYVPAIDKLIQNEVITHRSLQSIPREEEKYRFKFKTPKQMREAVNTQLIKNTIIKQVEQSVKDGSIMAFIEMDDDLKYGELVEYYE